MQSCCFKRIGSYTCTSVVRPTEDCDGNCSEVLIRVGEPGGHSVSQYRKAYALGHEYRRYRTGVPPYADTESSFPQFEERVRAIRQENEQSEVDDIAPNIWINHLIVWEGGT